MHWPLQNADHMIDRLGMQEMEQRRKADADRYEMEDPGFMHTQQRRVERRFKIDCLKAYQAETVGSSEVDYSSPLLQHHSNFASFHAWTQTTDLIFLAIHNPFFLPLQPDLKPSVDLSSSGGILIRCTRDRDLPPILHRKLPLDSIDQSIPFETVSNAPLTGIVLPKRQPGKKLTQLFLGDGIATRFFDCKGSVPCPGSYSFTHNLQMTEAKMEIVVAFWTKAGDIGIEITSGQIEIKIGGLMDPNQSLKRTLSSGRSLEPEKCGWALLSSDDKQIISIDLILEVVESKGGKTEVAALFIEDEDPFGLQTFLTNLVNQAMNQPADLVL